jgi:hypothetical protein
MAGAAALPSWTCTSNAIPWDQRVCCAFIHLCFVLLHSTFVTAPSVREETLTRLVHCLLLHLVAAIRYVFQI